MAHASQESTRRWRTLSGFFLSNYASVARRENEGIAVQSLALTALVIENYVRDSGQLPETLDELTPRFLAEVLEDPFDGLGLKYRRTESGYVLYSVGPDRQDNGGLEADHKKESDDKKSYDITFTVER